MAKGGVSTVGNETMETETVETRHGGDGNCGEGDVGSGENSGFCIISRYLCFAPPASTMRVSPALLALREITVLPALTALSQGTQMVTRALRVLST